MLAFITHGGMGGVFESAYAGVPISKAARRLSEQLQNKPFTPEDVLVRHIEYAVKNEEKERNPMNSGTRSQANTFL
ncbi:hypothetical protein TELCIR_10235 [Teladorsagia circumcincta]|uniref:Uncharacterized protein n=1 Tax=Teladorsagia circumcincta TaxID=45464 RepID=A0A2G9UCN6_TELCI|nr:hypothetical protein TELCIR_10235 [Teladorsagia circumcincta]